MRLRSWMVALLGLVGLARKRIRREREDGERIVEDAPAAPRAEGVVIVLLLLTSLCAAGFVVAYSLDAGTQVLGGTLAGTFALLGAALVVTARHLVVSEEIPEEYPQSHEEESEDVAEIFRESGSRLTRKRMLAATAGLAGTSIGAALITPAASLGPLTSAAALYRTPWRDGRRLVDSRGVPFRAEEIETETFYTAYPEGASRSDLGAPLVVVRLRPDQLMLPEGREDWAAEGILAYSKICTHAACAVSLYRTPKFAPTQPEPALVCPCHYSTFDPATGGTVTFGPAGRPLPQLPLRIDSDGILVAAGEYSDPVGPSWSGVRNSPPDRL